MSRGSSLKTGARAGQFDLENWDSLWSLLTRITLHKCGHKIEHFHAARRDVRRESAAPPDDDQAAQLTDLVEQFFALSAGLAEKVAVTLRVTGGFQPHAEREAYFATIFGGEPFFASLRADDRPILELALQGRTRREISDHLGVLERTVYRRLERARAQLERLRVGDGLSDD